ncbi:MAG TPA: hypothetical protein VEK57_20040 [Thermoanaerobaculia bacterium]|nr:hypothetical protein [Thermoanaerobaculia bacterium]
MMQYQLEISIDQKGLQQIYADALLVTIVRKVTSDPPATATVAWVAFAPFMANQVAWGEDYYLYAARRAAGEVIITIAQSQEPVRSGVLYQYAQGIFTAGRPVLFGTYDVENDDAEMAFGLMQVAVVNGTALPGRLNRTDLVAAQHAVFVPSETLSIFLAPATATASVIGGVPANALTVQFTSAQWRAEVTYDAEMGQFGMLGGS